MLGLFLGVLQLALALHTRNVLAAAAQEGARRGSLAGGAPADGAARARRAVADALSPAAAARMQYRARTVTRGGLSVVEVVVQGPLPLVLVPGAPVRVRVQGHALVEP